MGLIKIVANDITLDFVKETLSIKKENNSLSRDFKVAHSTFPFLIIENQNAKRALGTRDLSSVNKIKTIEVTVFEGGRKYMGQLQILSYLSGFRKCNLKYASELLSIMNVKIATFMPTVSVIPGETTPVPFSETSIEDIAGTNYWETYPIDFISRGFPDVKWQFPTMKWEEKFGKDLDAEDSWYLYEGEINRTNEDFTAFIENTFTESSSEITGVSNKNIPSPQIYLLAPLFYALQSKGFTAEGAFPSNAFIKKILLQSSKTNISETSLIKLVNTFVFGGSFTYLSSLSMHYKDESFAISVAGDYVLEYSFTFAGPLSFSNNPSLFKFFFQRPATGLFTPSDLLFNVTEITDTTFTVSGSQDFELVTGTSHVTYFAKNTVMPMAYEVKLKIKSEKKYQQMHPTIELGRYVPEWTFSTYLNALQNKFNLEINIDDFSKKMTIDFNEDTISDRQNTIIKKSLFITGYEQMPFEAFILKNDNDEDEALWITKSGVEPYALQRSDFSETLASKFKLVPTTYTANLSEALDSKNGVGLMIYNHETFPYTTAEYLGQNLNISGTGGIYQSFWRKFLKFRMNASSVEMSGPFTETELNKILALKSIFIDNQEYLISDTTYSETAKDNFNVKFNLLSITF